MNFIDELHYEAMRLKARREKDEEVYADERDLSGLQVSEQFGHRDVGNDMQKDLRSGVVRHRVSYHRDEFPKDLDSNNPNRKWSR